MRSIKFLSRERDLGEVSTTESWQKENAEISKRLQIKGDLDILVI